MTAAVRRQPAESTRNLLGQAADTPVYGAFVTLRRAGKLRSCCGHIELPVPLWAALDRAADRAATDDPRFPPISPAELSQLDVDVWILWGPEPVTARGEDRVQAVTIGKHGVQIARGHARGLLLPGVAVDHHLDALAFLQQVCIKAGLPTDAWKDDDTQLLVFEGDAIHGRLQPEWPEVRPPAVAGGFYPGDPGEVERSVEKLFAAAAPARRPSRGRAPWFRTPAGSTRARWRRPCSGGWRFPNVRLSFAQNTGRTARSGPWRRIAGGCFPAANWPRTRSWPRGWPPAWRGCNSTRRPIATSTPSRCSCRLLARLAPQVRVVGIAVGDSPLPELLRFGVAMSVVLRDMPQRPLLIVSSDMNHFANDAETRRLDRLALDAIATLDPECVYETVRGNRISMCGMAPCVVVMETLRWLGCLKRCESVGYATSAEASGDTSRVVGYAGLLFG